MSKPEDLPSKANKTAIVIVGVDQESDRTLMQVLGTLGCALPKDMRQSAEMPALGGFEPSAMRDLDQRLFDKAGASWDDVSPFHPEWRQSPGAKAIVKHAVTVLEDQFGNAPLIALGGRDLSRLFPLWAEALRLFGCNVRPIVMLRSPLEAGPKARERGECSQPLAEILWARRALDAEHFTRGMPRYFTSLERLCQSWDLVAHDAQEALQLTWPKPPANVELEIGKILEGVHASTDLQSRAMTSTLLPQWIRETYKILNGWAMSQEMAAHHALLDGLRADFDLAASAFGRVVRAERHEQLAAAEAQRRRMQAEIDRLSVKAADAEVARAAFVAEQEIWTAEQQVRAAECEALLLERDALLEERALLVASQESQAAAQEALLAHAAELESAARELASAKAALQDQRRTTTLLNADVQNLRDRASDLEAELREAREEVATTRARRKEMARVIASRDAQLKARYEELAQLQRQIVGSDPLLRIRRAFARMRRRLQGSGRGGSPLQG